MNKKRKYSLAFKVLLVKQIVEGRNSLCSVARENDMRHSTLQQWLGFYKAYGIAGLQRSGKQQYDSAFKLNAIRILKQGQLSLSDVCIQLKIPSKTMLANWLKKYENQGIEVFSKETRGKRLTMSENASKKPPEAKTKEQELEKENKYLRAENAYLKKLYALIQKEEAEKKKKR